MSTQSHRGPIVIDTDVYGAELVPGSKLAAQYEPIIVGRPAFISFQTVAELRFGALLRNWGEARLRKLDGRIAVAETVHTGPDLVATYARLRVDCERIGHALASANTTPTDGSPQPLFGSGSLLCLTIASLRTCRASQWRRRADPPRRACTRPPDRRMRSGSR